MRNLFLRMFIQMFLKLKQNLLQNVLRSKFGIEENQKLIIIGNPPYNNKTLIIKNGVKSLFAIDKNLSHRDLGISFCVFCCFVSAFLFDKTCKFNGFWQILQIFTLNSATFFFFFFLIVIALYEKNQLGMSYEFIQNFEFKTRSRCIFYTLCDINALKRNRSFL